MSPLNSNPYPSKSLSYGIFRWFIWLLCLQHPDLSSLSSLIMANIPDTKHSTHSQTSRNSLGQENRRRSSSRTRSMLPKWPRYLGIASHILVIIFCAIIIGLISFSLHKYLDTRNIYFSGIRESWPQDLNLRPSYLFMVLSSLSLAFSFASCAYLFLHRKSTTFTPLDIISFAMSGVIFIIWVAGDTVQTQSQRHPTADILEWSCRRSDSPTNALVSYASICNEQVALI